MSLRSIRDSSSNFSISLSTVKEKQPAIETPISVDEEDQIGFEVTKRQIETKKAIEFESHLKPDALDDVWLRTVLACEHFTDLDASAIPNRNLALTENELGSIVDVLNGLHVLDSSSAPRQTEVCSDDETAYSLYKRFYFKASQCQPSVSAKTSKQTTALTANCVPLSQTSNTSNQQAQSSTNKRPSSTLQSLLTKMNQTVSSRSNFWSASKSVAVDKSLLSANAAPDWRTNNNNVANNLCDTNIEDQPKIMEVLQNKQASGNAEPALAPSDSVNQSTVHSDVDVVQEPVFYSSGTSAEKQSEVNANGNDTSNNLPECSSEGQSQATSKLKLADPRLRKRLAGSVNSASSSSFSPAVMTAAESAPERPDSPSKLNFENIPNVVNSIMRTLERYEVTAQRTVASSSAPHRSTGNLGFESPNAYSGALASDSASTEPSLMSPDANKSSSSDSRRSVSVSHGCSSAPTASCASPPEDFPYEPDDDGPDAGTARFSDDDDDPFDYLRPSSPNANAVRRPELPRAARSSSTAHCLVRKLRAVTRDFSFHGAFVERARRSAFIEHDPANDPRLYHLRQANGKPTKASIYADVFRNEQASIRSAPPQSVGRKMHKVSKLIIIPTEFNRPRSAIYEPIPALNPDDVPPLIQVVQPRFRPRHISFSSLGKVAVNSPITSNQPIGTPRAKRKAKAIDEVIVISSDEEDSASVSQSKRRCQDPTDVDVETQTKVESENSSSKTEVESP